MWNVNPSRDQSRGGFQNRDVGKTDLDDNYGPDYGIDYAAFARTPDIQKDLFLKRQLEEKFALPDLIVRNGFVIIKGTAPDEKARAEIIESVRSFPGVVEVINQITITH